MSLFRKPKKIQRRVTTLEEEEAVATMVDADDFGDGMDVDEMEAPPPPTISNSSRRSDKKEKSKKSSRGAESSAMTAGGTGGGAGTVDAKIVKTQAKALLSFADDEDDAEVFQVRKSSHSKKVMRMMDKERRKKRKEGTQTGTLDADATQMRERHENGRGADVGSRGEDAGVGDVGSSNSNYWGAATGVSKYRGASPMASSSSAATSRTASASEQCTIKKTDSIQTEIRTDDFVLVVKKTEPKIILNGRAALCAGRNDVSDEEEEDACDVGHRFSKPEQLKQMLESGSIPDAAMIHAARKRRQKAREQGDFIPVEEPKEQPKKGSRLAREDVEGDNSDDEERVDMNAITGKKEREERREQFYSVENDYSAEDSEHETNEWENQQIRKGVTGAQLVSAQHESVLSRFMIKPTTNNNNYSGGGNHNALEAAPQSTSTLLEQAYAKNALDKPQQMLNTTKVKKDKAKTPTLRAPNEIKEALSTRLSKLKELNVKHTSDMERIVNELKVLKLEELDCNQRAPTAAAKYRFYQEVKCYVTDLVDCLNEKTPVINELEKRTLQMFAKHANFLIERRRQDVRDQAKEMAEASKPATARRDEEQIRRAAEREGRRTRRRCEREKNEMSSMHLDGMSSDEETSDRYQEQFQNALEQIDKEAEEVFSDVTDEFCKIDLILMKFYAWRKTDMESYADAFVSLCLPKILGPLVRWEILSWSPLLEEYKEIEKMNWYASSMLYAWSEEETLETLRNDADVQLVPTIIEKILIPKVTEIVNQCWDPLSTTQSLRLIGFINRLGRDFPLKGSSKSLQLLFAAVLEKMKLALDTDVFIPIFPKQVQEAKTSFFQRQFCSGLKLFRNFLSWQGIIADRALREMAIGALLNRYLLLAMRVCTANDAISKAYVVVNTLPTVWLQPHSETLQNLQLFIAYIKQILENCDVQNPLYMHASEKANLILQRLHSL